MNLLYLIRHGQAGTRDEYDRLSSLGEVQARALGGWLTREGVSFDAVWCGGLRRQQETAAIVLKAMTEAGLPQPEPRRDPRWNEFDLDAVCAGIAPRMAAGDPDFRERFETLRQAIRMRDARIDRTWTATDSAIVLAWIAGRYPFEGESWTAFVARVRAAAGEVVAAAHAAHCTAVFTSATPVAIALSLALPLSSRDMLRLAGASINSNVTILNVSDGQPQLFAFNGTAHLQDPAQRTFR